MSKLLNLTIATPEGIIFQGEVTKVKLPGKMGNFMVLPMHAPLISSLSSGKISYEYKNELSELLIKGGFVEINKDVISTCVEI